MSSICTVAAVIRSITWRISAMKPALEAPESSLELVLPLTALPHNMPEHFLIDVPKAGSSAHVSILPPYLVIFRCGKTRNQPEKGDCISARFPGANRKTEMRYGTKGRHAESVAHLLPSDSWQTHPVLGKWRSSTLLAVTCASVPPSAR